MLSLRRKLWPKDSPHGHLRLAGERAFSVFCMLAGVSGLGITLINLPYLADFPLTVGLGGLIAILCLGGPFFVVGAREFNRNARIFGHLVGLLLLVLSLAAREMVSPSNLLFVPAVLTMTLALGWRDGLVTLGLAFAAYGGTFVMTGGQWAADLPHVNTMTLIAGQILAASFVFAGSGAFRRQMVHAAKELQHQTELAEEASRAKSEFLATVSHEIRTPLNGVLGMARILEDGTLRPDQTEQVRAIAQSGELLLTTLNDVLDLSRIEAGQMTMEIRAFDVTAMIDGLARVYAGATAEKGVGFAVEISPDLDLAHKRVGDENRITQILHNLLSNAVKFTAEGGVDLSVMPGDIDDEIRFVVRDTGIGMNEEQRQHIFDQFVQADQSTSRKFGGSGLGLSIVAQLADLMQGQVAVDSQPGAGSRFTLRLRLPVDAALATGDGSQAAVSGAPVPAPVRDLRILVVDDVSINRAVMRGMLAKLGYHARYAASGEEAVRAVEHDAFDIVFLDISMPGMNGYETLDRIRELETAATRKPSIIIAQTANVMSHQLNSYSEAGFDGALGKPILMEPLEAHLKAV